MACLEIHHTTASLTPCTARHLAQHLEGLLIGTEVRIVEHGVCIKYAHYADILKVKTLADHLCAYKNLCAAGREVVYDTLVSVLRTCRVEVHTRYAGESELRESLLHLLRSISPLANITAEARRTLVGYRVSIPTVMASQLPLDLMHGQRHVTVLALRDPSTLMTLDKRSKATAVLEEYNLSPIGYRLPHRIYQLWGERAVHHLPTLQVGNVHYDRLWKLHTLVALGKHNKMVLAGYGVMVRLKRRRGRPHDDTYGRRLPLPVLGRQHRCGRGR